MRRLHDLPTVALTPDTLYVSHLPRPSVAGLRFRRRVEEFVEFFEAFFDWLGAGTKVVLRAALSFCWQVSRCALVLAFSLWLLIPSQAVESGPRLVDASQAVVDFHRALEGRAYQAAYRQMSPAWQAQLGYEPFVRGFEGASLSCLQVVGVEPLTRDAARVQVLLRVTRAGHSVDYAGHYAVRFNGRGWTLDSGKLKPRARMVGQRLSPIL
ncbi:MAG: hypothetical protein KC910_32955 [Candidatus Eremiobacteraeota bacterium]|nr:hypothetical protein [Candidatus Eremiobacteraeota bacterium]